MEISICPDCGEDECPRWDVSRGESYPMDYGHAEDYAYAYSSCFEKQLEVANEKLSKIKALLEDS